MTGGKGKRELFLTARRNGGTEGGRKKCRDGGRNGGSEGGWRGGMERGRREEGVGAGREGWIKEGKGRRMEGDRERNKLNELKDVPVFSKLTSLSLY